MIVDFDDFAEGNDGYEYLHELKRINPAFKCTLFAVPGLASYGFWATVPDWCELAVHGYLHSTVYECANWTKDRMFELMDYEICQRFFVKGFKAPGWQISDGCYDALLEKGWWVADQHLEDHRRPQGLPTYFYEDGGDRHHGHIQNVCGNGLEETWDELSAKVAAATEFRFCSEALV